MRKRLLVFAIGLGALSIGQAAPAQGATAKCTARKSTTILQTPSVRIYATPLGNTAARVYGCLYSQNRRRFLGVDGDCDPGPAIDQITSRGRYVALVQSFCNIDSSDDYVVVRDLRTGATKYRAIAATGTRADDGEPSTLVSDLALSSNGSVAWIGLWDAVSGNDDPHPNDDRQVRKLDPAAPEGGTLLDSGVSIELRSLGLGSRTSAGYAWLYWTKGGAPFAAKLN